MVKRPESPHQRVVQLQRKIFESLRREANQLLGKTPSVIQAYEKENRRDFPLNLNKLKVISKDDLIEAIRQVDVAFIADFHTFDQAQRTALRILRDTIRPGERWYLGVELVSSHHQSLLNSFQRGKISEKEFLKEIAYSEEWGFPWKNYAPLFEWCKTHQVKMIALNRPKSLFQGQERQELHDRDQWAAGVITDLFHHDLNRGLHPKMMVLYGELHVVRQHLPHQLKKISRSFLKAPLNSISIHQNDEKLFWKLTQSHQELSANVIQLRKNAYCVFSSTPWLKLQSLVNWADGEINPDWADEEGDGEVDYLSLVQNYGKTISEFFRITPPSYESITVCTIGQLKTLKILLESHAFRRDELQIIHHHVAHNHRLYIPKASIVYLGSPSQNGAAELSAIHILRSYHRWDHLLRPTRDDYFRAVLEYAFGFFGSLLLNPRRKCDLPQDHVNRILVLQTENRKSDPYEKNAREIALSLLQSQNSQRSTFEINLLEKKEAPAHLMSARYVGYILGKKLYTGVIEDLLPVSKAFEIFFQTPSTQSSSFEMRYYSLIQGLRSVSIAGSKQENL